MYPSFLNFHSDNTVSKQPVPGKPFEKMNFEDFSEKELLLRLVSISQSLRTMVQFFVVLAILEIIGK